MVSVAVIPRSIPYISLSNRTQIDHFDAGLSSVEGAQEVIEMIASRQSVTRLMLGSNDLGDDGAITVFEYLSSDVGKKYKITEISLNSNGIGDLGLLAIAKYLHNNTHLKALFLQNNKFEGSPTVIQALVSAINTSVLNTISFTTNRGLADSFVEQFLPKLDSPTLAEIHLSVMNLTSHSTPYIIEYISSLRCRLRMFKCNGNHLGYRSVRQIIEALERSNFGLIRVELYSNDSNVSGETGEEESPWEEGETVLNRLLLRNDHLSTVTMTEALRLLRFSRALLLRPNDARRIVVTSVFPFLALPIELQLYILSFLAPALSSAQLVRIYTYACSPSTLPSLLSLPDRSLSTSERNKREIAPRRTGWRTRKDEERIQWLDKVGCSMFELGGQLPDYDFWPLHT